MRLMFTCILALVAITATPLPAQERIASADRTKMRETRETMRALAQDLRAWQATHEDKFPEKLNQLVEANLRDAVPKDGWGNDFTYVLDDIEGYKLTSYGSNGKAGGDGAAADIVWTRNGEHIVLTEEEQDRLEQMREAARHEARVTVARKQMVVAGLEALRYRRDKNEWPASLQDAKRAGEEALDKAVNVCFSDPWGNPYELRVMPHDNVAIVCWGADGAEGGKDRAADFVIAERDVRAYLNSLKGEDRWNYRGYYDWQAQNLAHEINMYKDKAGKVPEKLEDLGKPLPGEDAPVVQFEGVPKDRWGNEYIYLRLSDQDFAVVGLGKDSLSGGVDDNEDYVFPVPGGIGGDDYFGGGMVRVAARNNVDQKKADEEKQNALVEVATEQMSAIVEQLKAYKDENGEYPETLDDIADKMPGGEMPKDPWDHEFAYAVKDDGSFTLTCLGSDGAEGGEGYAADIVFTPDGKQAPAEEIADDEAVPEDEAAPVPEAEPAPERKMR